MDGFPDEVDPLRILSQVQAHAGHSHVFVSLEAHGVSRPGLLDFSPSHAPHAVYLFVEPGTGGGKRVTLNKSDGLSSQPGVVLRPPAPPPVCTARDVWDAALTHSRSNLPSDARASIFYPQKGWKVGQTAAYDFVVLDPVRNLDVRLRISNCEARPEVGAVP